MIASHEAKPINPETWVMLEVMVASLAADRTVFDPEMPEMIQDLVADRYTDRYLSSLVLSRRQAYALVETAVGGFTPEMVFKLLTTAITPGSDLSKAAAGLVLDWFMRNLDDDQLPVAIRLMAPLLGAYGLFPLTDLGEEA